jgi:hypothetical protein
MRPVPAVTAFVLGLAAAVTVEGASTCPSPAAVGERLSALLPPADTGARDVARIEPEGSGVRITLRRADGSAAGTRTLAGEHTCDELAEAAAVIIAAWQNDGAARDPLPAPPPPPRPAVRAPAPARAPPPVRWQIGAGAGGAAAGTTLAPAALIDGGLAPAGGPLGAGLRASISGNRTIELNGGSARWRRALATLGPRLRLERATLAFQADAGAGISWLALEGVGFAQGQRHDAALFGLAAGLRAAWRRPGFEPWIDAGVALWPRATELFQLPDGYSTTLPRLELLLTLGVSLAP